jgi:hypothetical protein
MKFQRFFNIFLAVVVGLGTPLNAGSQEAPAQENVTAELVTYGPETLSETVKKFENPQTKEKIAAILLRLKATGDEALIRLVRASEAELSATSPANLEEAFMNSLLTKSQNTIDRTLIRFPMETLVFYAVIFFNSLVHTKFVNLTAGYEIDPAPLKTFEKMLKDPIGIMSFLCFMLVAGGTHFYGQEIIDWIIRTVQFKNAVRLQLISSEGVAKSAAGTEVIKKFKLDKEYFKYTKQIHKALPALAMAFGMSTSRIVEQAFHDQNIQKCAKGFSLESQENFNEHCKLAFDSWVKDGRLWEFSVDFATLFFASKSAHKLIDGAKDFFKSKKSTSKSAEILLKGLEFQWNKGAVLSYTVRNLPRLIVAPVTWLGAVNFSLFMALDAFGSSWTMPLKSADRGRKLLYDLAFLQEDLHEFTDAFRKDSPTKKKSDKCEVGKGPGISSLCWAWRLIEKRDLANELFRYGMEWDDFREMQMAGATQLNTNWLNATNELISVYQETHGFYKDFIKAHDKANLSTANDMSFYEVRDFFKGVKVYSKDGQTSLTESNVFQEFPDDKKPNQLLFKLRLATILKAKNDMESFVRSDGYKPDAFRQKIVEIVNYLNAADFSLPANRVMLPKELKLFTAGATSSLNNTDANGMKEFDLRMLRVEEGLRLLDKAVKIPNAPKVLADAKKYIGDYVPARLPGIAHLDKFNISEEHVEHYPSHLGDMRGLKRPVDYLVANMICGTTHREQRKKEYPYIYKFPGYSYQFLPPLIVKDDRDRENFCEYHYKYKLYDGVIPYKQKEYNGILELIANNLNPELVGHDGMELKFDKWWSHNLGEPMKKFLEDRHEEYKTGMRDKFYPVVFNTDLIQDETAWYQHEDVKEVIRTGYLETVKNIENPITFFKAMWFNIRDQLAPSKKLYLPSLSKGVLRSINEEAVMHISILHELFANMTSKIEVIKKDFDFDKHLMHMAEGFRRELVAQYGEGNPRVNIEFKSMLDTVQEKRALFEKEWQKEHKELLEAANNNRLGEILKLIATLDETMKTIYGAFDQRENLIRETGRIAILFSDKNEAAVANLTKIREHLDLVNLILTAKIETLNRLTKLITRKNLDLKMQAAPSEDLPELTRLIEVCMIRLNQLNLKSEAYGNMIFIFAKNTY